MEKAFQETGWILIALTSTYFFALSTHSWKNSFAWTAKQAATLVALGVQAFTILRWLIPWLTVDTSVLKALIAFIGVMGMVFTMPLALHVFRVSRRW